MHTVRTQIDTHSFDIRTLTTYIFELKVKHKNVHSSDRVDVIRNVVAFFSCNSTFNTWTMVVQFGHHFDDRIPNKCSVEMLYC